MQVLTWLLTENLAYLVTLVRATVSFPSFPHLKFLCSSGVEVSKRDEMWMQSKMIDRIDGLLGFSTFQKQVLCFRMISLYILKYDKNQKI